MFAKYSLIHSTIWYSGHIQQYYVILVGSSLTNLLGISYIQDIQEAHAGQIVAVFGVDCATGKSFSSVLLTLHG